MPDMGLKSISPTACIPIMLNGNDNETAKRTAYIDTDVNTAFTAVTQRRVAPARIMTKVCVLGALPPLKSSFPTFPVIGHSAPSEGSRVGIRSYRRTVNNSEAISFGSGHRIFTTQSASRHAKLTQRIQPLLPFSQ
jgi:hypothetical protein